MVADIQIEEVRTAALDWPGKARALTIIDVPSYNGAAALLQGIKALRKQITEVFSPHVKRAHEAHKALVKEQADAEAPLTDAESIIKRGLVAYDAAQEQIRQAEQRRLQDEARQVEEQRRIEEAAAMESEAKATGDAQLQAEAEALIAAPVYVAPVQVEKATPVISGISYRTTYSARVVDKLKLVQFVAANPQFLGLVAADMVALNGQARSLKMAMQIPGVVVDEKRDVTAGAGR
jgi:chemotaxis protein histidine kinase CheA